MRILIVDDDQSALDLCAHMLKGYGQCDTALDALSGLELYHAARAQGRPYHLVVMDVVMPEVDGLTAAEELLASQADLHEQDQARLLVVTAHMDPATRERALRLGAHAFLNKPLTRQALDATLACLGLSGDACED